MVGALNETRDMTRARLGCLELKLRDDNGVDLYLTRRNGGMILLDSLSAAELETFEYDVHLMVSDSR
ncbi:hypothetical protein [Bifidobacterium animalis]|uniref:hypothetical protein n=1 Tax=Bifidobacterium animalis TaxID=28025 RepID=UPI001C3EDF97|nr:hypothetical protein [Bifidobacterium animalis]MCR1995035.1 hypothetical protein [Bifidobacterium animalis subsp. animalis]